MIERIKQIFRVKAQCNKSKLARDLNMNTRTVTQYIEGEIKPSADFLVNILAAYSDVSAEWLMRGKGTMVINTVPQQPINYPYNIMDLLEKTLAENAVLKAKLEQKGKTAV